MKLQILKTNLKQALDILKRVASKSSSLPILNTALLTTKKNRLELASTDLEIGIRYKALAKIKKQGKIAIPAKTFSNLVNSLPKDSITLSSKGNDLNIKCKNYKSQLKGLDPKEFPIIPEIKEQFTELDINSLIGGLSQVIEVASPSKIRPEISGIYINFDSNNVNMVATDSFRLAEKTVSLSKKIDSESSLILPHKAGRELINIFSQSNQKLKVYLSENQIMFKTESTEKTEPQLHLTSKLIEGEYPDYKKIIPEDYKTQLTISKDKFLNQIKTASLFGGKVNEINIKVAPDQDRVEILSEDPNLGKNRSFLSATIKGEKVETSFNWRFLRDGLSNINTDQILFELNGKEGAAVLKPTKKQNFIYVVMPIKSS